MAAMLTVLTDLTAVMLPTLSAADVQDALEKMNSTEVMEALSQLQKLDSRLSVSLGKLSVDGVGSQKGSRPPSLEMPQPLSAGDHWSAFLKDELSTAPDGSADGSEAARVETDISDMLVLDDHRRLGSGERIGSLSRSWHERGGL